MKGFQWLGRQWLLGKNGCKWGPTKIKIPHCEACTLGKQQRIPKAGSQIKPDREKKGILKQEKFSHGDLVLLTNMSALFLENNSVFKASCQVSMNIEVELSLLMLLVDIFTLSIKLVYC